MRSERDERAERLARAMLEGVAGIESALMAETIASVWFVPIADDDAGRDLWELGKAICEWLESRADSDSLAVLTALHAVSPERLTTRLARGVERLRDRGAEPPFWANHAGPAMRPVAALRAESEWWDDETIIAIEFDNGQADDLHSLMMVINNNTNEPTSMEIVSPFERLCESLQSSDRYRPDSPDRRLIVNDIELPEAATRMLVGLSGVPLVGVGDPDFERCFTMIQSFQLFEARIARMDFINGFKTFETLDPTERAEIADEFILDDLSEPVRAHNWIEEFLFGALEFMSEDVGGSALRFSPGMIDEFITYYLLDELIVEPSEAELVIVALEQLSRFFAERQDLPDVALEMCLAKIDQRRAEMIEGLTDLKGWRPARRIALEIRRAGVDIEDRPAVDAFIAEFNQRVARGDVEDW